MLLSRLARRVTCLLIATSLLGVFYSAPVPAAEPPSGKIVFHRYGKDGNSTQIWIANADGTGAEQITSGPESHSGSDVSTDGSKVAFTRSDDNGRGDIYVVDIDGTNEKQMTSGPEADSDPRFSPDGGQIAFTRDLGDFTSRRRTYIVGSDGGGLHALFPEEPLDSSGGAWWNNFKDHAFPEWSPDGSQIAACYDDYGINLVEVADPTNSDEFEFVADGCLHSWLGSKLAFFDSSQPDKIFTVEVGDPSTRKIVLDSPAALGIPVWSPDGSTIAYETYDSRVHFVTAEGVMLETSFPGWNPIGWIGGKAPPTTCTIETAKPVGSLRASQEPKCMGIDKVSFNFTDRINQRREQLYKDRYSSTGLSGEADAAARRVKSALEDLDVARRKHANAEAKLDGTRRQLSTLRNRLNRDKFEDRPVSRKDENTLEHLGNLVHDLIQPEIDARKGVEKADAIVRDRLREQAVVEEKIVELGKQLQALSFGVKGLSASADGIGVFDAHWSLPDKELDDLDAKIRKLRLDILPSLESERRGAFQDFVTAHKESTKRLQEVAERIWEAGLVKAGSKFVSNGVELLEAAAEGGWIKVGARLIIQIVEAAYDTYTDDDTQGDPNPGAKDIDEWLKQGALDTVKDLGKSRFVIEEGKDRLKDPAVDGIESWVKTTFCGDASCPKPDVGKLARGVDPDRVMKRAIGMDTRIKILKRRIRNGATDWLKGKAKDLALEDLPEQVVDARENKAWSDYIVSDINARMKFALYRAADQGYWRVIGDLELLLEKKAKIMSQWDPNTELKTDRNNSFDRPKNSFTVTLDFELRGTEVPPLEVFVEQGTSSLKFSKVSVTGSKATYEFAPGDFPSSGSIQISVR